MSWANKEQPQPTLPQKAVAFLLHKVNHNSLPTSIDYFQLFLFNQNPEISRQGPKGQHFPDFPRFFWLFFTFFQIPIYTRCPVVSIPLALRAVHEKD
jgi:hypothetical protein